MKRYLTVFSAVLLTFSGYSALPYDKYPAYSGDDLELTVSGDTTRFALWAPTARAVKLRLYNDGEKGAPYAMVDMHRSSPYSPWRTEIDSLLYGKFYTFSIQTKDGKWLAETPGIWAKAVGVNGKRAAIIDMAATNPEGWENDRKPELKNFTDIILYEVHHRDFSIDSTSGIRNKGKFLALTEEGSRSPQGLKTGIDHLKELGVTHVHILPSYDFGSIDETQLGDNKYNWGYDPQNYNVPEGSYSTDPYDPATRIREMKEMIQAMHKNGLRVVMDVVYNHTYTGDGSNFSLTVPGYFYRHNPDGSYSDASGCGNETASEREMMRRYLIESVLYWVKEYHVDGFRFDLMGIHDIETMNQLRAELDKIDPSIFIYGEGWAAGNSPYPAEKRGLKVNAPKMPGVAVFSDDIRDAVKGSVHKDKEPGFASGQRGLEESVKFGIVGATRHPQIDYTQVNYSDAPYALSPADVINYVSCHDDFCLVDKFKISVPDASEEDLLRFDKLARTIILTSQGVPFIFAGEEVFRDKKGVKNSYESPDSINRIDWSQKEKYNDLFSYYKQLIELRKNHPAFRMTTAEDIQKHLEFAPQTQPNVVSYLLKDHANGDSWADIWVTFNGNDKDAVVRIPQGTWTVICDNGQINENGIRQVSGGNVVVPPFSALIMKR